MQQARQALAITSTFIFLAFSAGAAADAGPPVGRTAEHCERLRYADFAGIEDAPTQVMASEVADASGDRPAFCKVQGYVSPNIGFELRLPMSGTVPIIWDARPVDVRG